MTSFSFFIHFRGSFREDIQFFWRPLGWIPESFYERLFTRFGYRSYCWSTVRLKQANKPITDVGTLEAVPMSAPMMLNMNREAFVAKMNVYLDKLVAKGVKVVGLGALTAPLTAGGLALAQRKDICLTNGNAFTAVMMAQSIEKIIQETGLQRPKVAIVGATGSVGSCVTQLLARNNMVQDFLLISQTLRKLERFAITIQKINLNADIQISTDLMTLTDADIVVVLTASNETLILPKHLKKNAIVLDGTQPRNIAPDILTKRPDVTLIDGGLVTIQNMALSMGSLALRDGEYYACFSETVLLALEGHEKHFCLGNATLEQADWIAQIALKHSYMGFQLAPFSAFGKPVFLKKQQISLIPTSLEGQVFAL
jgi:fatty aldehyde-generating acyl-ACP reductase